MIGQEFETKQIEEIMLKKFTGMARGSVRPNDHGEGNEDECPCAHTDKRIFDKIKRGLYRVRPNL
jgi:hypothetical protein